MSEQAKISKKSFLSAIIILFSLLILSGLLTRIIPMGLYDSYIENGKRVIIPGSYHLLNEEPLSILKWFMAPIEVLFSNDGALIISIIIFLLIVGGSIHVLNESNVLSSIINKIVLKFKDNRYLLIRIIVLIFMSLGAFVGIFEEIIPLIPLMISLSIGLGFDILTGLGISLLSTGFGFAAAVSNPFTIGVAQQVAGVPIFSGSLFRLVIFLVTYLVLSQFVINHAKKNETTPKEVDLSQAFNKKGTQWFLMMMSIIFLTILLVPFVDFVASYNLVIIGLLFLIAGLGTGLITLGKSTFKVFLEGIVGILPGVILILLATGVKHIIETGYIMDTILYRMSENIGSSSYVSLLMVYLFVFIMNFFIGSGSAKAFIIIPIIAPLMDLIGVSRQLSILAFQFGDGFSNILFPTNAVLLIGLGIANVSYVKWLKYVFKIQLIIGLVSVLALYIGLLIGY